MKKILLAVLLLSSNIWANESATEQASPQASAPVCRELEQLLVSVQARSVGEHAEEAHALNRKVRKSYIKLCEGSHNFTQEQIDQEVFDLLNENANSSVFQQLNWGDMQNLMAQAPILGSYMGKHRQCASGCSYVSWGIWGDKKHQARKSCHNSGEAIDIHAINCRGRQHAAKSSRFGQYVSCMRGKFYVIYGSGDHANHAHIQFHNCRKVKGNGNTGGTRRPDPGPRPRPRPQPRPRPNPRDDDDWEDDDYEDDRGRGRGRGRDNEEDDWEDEDDDSWEEDD